MPYGTPCGEDRRSGPRAARRARAARSTSCARSSRSLKARAPAAAEGQKRLSVIAPFPQPWDRRPIATFDRSELTAHPRPLRADGRGRPLARLCAADRSRRGGVRRLPPPFRAARGAHRKTPRASAEARGVCVGRRAWRGAQAGPRPCAACWPRSSAGLCGWLGNRHRADRGSAAARASSSGSGRTIAARAWCQKADSSSSAEPITSAVSATLSSTAPNSRNSSLQRVQHVGQRRDEQRAAVDRQRGQAERDVEQRSRPGLRRSSHCRR